ncbi:MAG: hypothetical protein ACRCUY_00205 [Thermoguttaceae bacterium]
MMLMKISPKWIRGVLLLGLGVAISFHAAGCSMEKTKTNRGYLFRSDWAFEYNRTPWIGCPPDAGCDDERTCGLGGGQEVRRYCAVFPECTAKQPCCRTLGCGMVVKSDDPNAFAGMSSTIKACGMTPFCSPMKPCGLTPTCGRLTDQAAQQAVVLGNMGQKTSMPRPNVSNAQNMQNMQNMPNMAGANMQQPQMAPPMPPMPDISRAVPQSSGLISMGIVPGVSTITTGGVVAAIGVVTPVGMMTPSGVQLPNGTLQSNAILKSCSMNPNCTPTRPCGASPGCGMMVPVNLVSNNAMMLASALQMQGGGIQNVGGIPGYVNGNVMTAGGIPTDRMGTGMLVNPITGQPVSGLSMNGGPQLGYPPIGYTPTGYSPKYPRPTEESKESNEEAENPVAQQNTGGQSKMPVPRFYPVPTTPPFQRSEGIPVQKGGASDSRKVTQNSRIEIGDNLSRSSDEREKIQQVSSVNDSGYKSAIEQAYLEGMSDAMDGIEEELAVQSHEVATKRKQAEILKKSERLQSQLESKKEMELRVYEAELQREARREAQLQAAKNARLQEARLAEMEAAQYRAALIQQERNRASRIAPVPSAANSSDLVSETSTKADSETDAQTKTQQKRPSILTALKESVPSPIIDPLEVGRKSVAGTKELADSSLKKFNSAVNFLAGGSTISKQNTAEQIASSSKSSATVKNSAARNSAVHNSKTPRP